MRRQASRFWGGVDGEGFRQLKGGMHLLCVMCTQLRLENLWTRVAKVLLPLMIDVCQVLQIRLARDQ